MSHLVTSLPLVVSHTNPRVAYVAAPDSGTTQAVLRRTDDGGGTWTDLPIPSDMPTLADGTPNHAGITYLQLAVSPTDPRIVLLGVQDVSPQCPGPAPVALTGGRLYSGAPMCFYDYYSADGGMHWRRLSLPLDGLLALGSAGSIPILYTLNSPASSLRSQSERLYAMLVPYADGRGGGLHALRLAASDDDGASWNLADVPLVASGQNIVAYTPIPGEANGLYAVACPDRTCQNGVTLPSGATQAPLGLWRSDDAGADWQAVGAIPNSVRGGVPDVAIAAASPSLLYVETSGTPDQPGQYRAEVSTDGGRSWAWAPPSAGSDEQVYTQQLVGVDATGDALIAYSRFGMGVPPDTIVYTWKAGDVALHQVAPALDDAASVTDLWLAPGSTATSQTLWCVVQTASGYAARTYKLS